jgi:hypothetical protein
MRTSLIVFAIGFLVAPAARRFVTVQSGLTFSGRTQTTYIPLNDLAFWLVIAATVVLGVFYMERWIRAK